MHISLIGMSNIGKTVCARHLAALHGYKHIDCDVLIERKLEAEFPSRKYNGITGVAEWMGFPSSPQYKKNSDLYIAYEREVVQEALASLAKDESSSVVIDTTGSVIYLGDDILTELRAATRVIYLEASEEHTESLFKHFMSQPKPVIWDESYAPLADEAPEQTLKRCYPELLRRRTRKYKEIAHVSIPIEEVKNQKQNLNALILEKLSQ